MIDKPMTVEEVAAILWPGNETMQQKYIRARAYMARANVRRKVVIGKHIDNVRVFAPRTQREAFQ